MSQQKLWSFAFRALVALAFVVVLSSATQSKAMPVVCYSPACATWTSGEGANAHSYIFVNLTADVTWTEANALAQASIPLPDGSVGYLATIESAEEQAFIQNVVMPALLHYGTNPTQVWIGGRQEPNQPPTEGWQWVVNPEVAPETWNYTNWTTPGQPDDLGGIDEQYLAMWNHYYRDGVDQRGTWNDETDQATARIVGMIVEFSPKNLPEPGAAALIALGVGLLALRGRRSSQ